MHRGSFGGVFLEIVSNCSILVMEEYNTVNSGQFLSIGPQIVVGRGWLNICKEEYNVTAGVSLSNV